MRLLQVAYSGLTLDQYTLLGNSKQRRRVRRLLKKHYDSVNYMRGMTAEYYAVYSMSCYKDIARCSVWDGYFETQQIVEEIQNG
jgi:hypothetical protein